MRKSSKLLLVLVLILIVLITFLAAAVIAYEKFELKETMIKFREGANSSWNCQGYSYYYIEQLEKNNIEYKTTTMQTSSKSTDDGIYLRGHMFVIAYNSEGYCVLDQQIINCIKYVSDGDTK